MLESFAGRDRLVGAWADRGLRRRCLGRRRDHAGTAGGEQRADRHEVHGRNACDLP